MHARRVPLGPTHRHHAYVPWRIEHSIHIRGWTCSCLGGREKKTCTTLPSEKKLPTLGPAVQSFESQFLVFPV